MYHILEETGFTSINLARVICEMMHREGVSNEYVYVTKHHNIMNKHPAKKLNRKYVYMSYDSETVVPTNDIWDEMKTLKSNEPELIITVSKNSYDFYKDQGFNTYYLKIGYDDLHYKDERTNNRKYVVSSIGTIDNVRFSNFYIRFMVLNDVKNYLNLKGKESFLSNRVEYPDINKIYANSLMGYNDIIINTNQRCFEIPINGAAMLVNEQVRETDYPLKENKHYLVYNSPAHLLTLIKRGMENEEKMLKMGERARKEALKYPQSKYVKEMVDKLGLNK